MTCTGRSLPLSLIGDISDNGSETESADESHMGNQLQGGTVFAHDRSNTANEPFGLLPPHTTSISISPEGTLRPTPIKVEVP